MFKRFKILLLVVLVALGTACTRSDSVNKSPCTSADGAACSALPELERWTEHDDGSRTLETWYETGEKRSRCEYANYGRILHLVFWDIEGYVCGEWEGPMRVVQSFRTESDDELPGSGFGQLRGVYLRGNPNVTGKGLLALASLEELEWVDVRECPNIADADISAFDLARPKVEVRK